jgi:hypothetical protein
MNKIYALPRVHETPYMRELTEICVNIFTVSYLLTQVRYSYTLQGKYIVVIVVTNIYVKNKSGEWLEAQMAQMVECYLLGCL